MKKILIVGAGNAQIDLIEYCKREGFTTYGCSYSSRDSGIPLLDYFEQINITDTPEIIDYIRKNSIDYVYSIGSDIAMPAVTAAAEACGLPHFVSSETANVCNNKLSMRLALGKNNSFNIPFISCLSIEEAQNAMPYPYVIKPVDAHGQRGVFTINKEEDLEHYFDLTMAFSRQKRIVIEKYVGGDEISVNAYIADGKVIFRIFSDRESYSNYPGGIIKSHHLPSKYSQTEVGEKINKIVQMVINKLSIKNGPVYLQIKVENGMPYIIEITPRLDGCHLWRMIREYCGVDLLKITMKHLTEGKVDIPDYVVPKGGCHLEFMCEAPGTIFNREKFNRKTGIFKRFYYNTGDTVRKMNGYMEKCGYVIHKSPLSIALVGGSGFIGKQFVKQYGNGYDIRTISRTADGPMKTDYSKESLISAMTGCDSAVILAGKKVSAKEPQSMSLYDVNISIVENTLEACRELEIKNIVFLSSRCVYGSALIPPFAEDARLSPINFYGISKASCEMLCEYYFHKYDMNIKVLRLSQVVGAEDREGFMIQTFIKNALENKPLQVFGNSKGKRDYIYIKDACRGILTALNYAGESGIFNLGSGKGTSNYEVARAVCSAMCGSENIEIHAEKPEDTSLTWLDVGKIRQEFGFRCDYDINAMMDDIRKELREQVIRHENTV